MPSKVVSVRMNPQTLADVYNFLHLACEYNVANLPVSRAVTMSLDNMMRWVRQTIELPDYETDEEALAAVESFINKIPAAYIEKTDRPALIHTQPPVKEETVNHLIDHNLRDNSQPEGADVRPAAGASGAPTPDMLEQAKAVSGNEVAEKKERLVSLIDEFRDKVEKQEGENLLNAIKVPSLYKEEE